MDVEQGFHVTLTVHNLLFHPQMLWLSDCTLACYWLKFWYMQNIFCLCTVMVEKYEQKHRTMKFAELHNHSPLLTMVYFTIQFSFNYQAIKKTYWHYTRFLYPCPPPLPPSMTSAWRTTRCHVTWLKALPRRISTGMRCKQTSSINIHIGCGQRKYTCTHNSPSCNSEMPFKVNLEFAWF